MYKKEDWELMKNLKKLLKRLVIVCILIYAATTFINQQKILNTYATNKQEVEEKLISAKQEQEELKKIQENVNSKEYIEQNAREKLDMYLPNERAYVNIEQ